MDYLMHGWPVTFRRLAICVLLLLSACETSESHLAKAPDAWTGAAAAGAVSPTRAALASLLVAPFAILAEPAPALPVVAAPPPPAETAAAAPSNFLNWNFWVSDSSEAALRPQVAKTIGLAKQQTMWFRISSIDHSLAFKGVGKVGLSSALGSHIDEQTARERKGKLGMVALVVSADPSAIKIPQGQQAREFSIDMDKLAASPPTSLGTTTPEESWRASNIGEFSVEFTALKPGRHRLGIVLVEKSSGIPMQTLSIELDPDSSGDNPIASLGRNVGVAIAEGAAADFSLVLQDMSSDRGPSLVAVLVSHDSVSGANRFFTWNTGKSLAEVQGDISGFRSSLSAPLSDSQHLELSWEFGRSLFNPVVNPMVPALSGDNAETARQARGALLQAALDPGARSRPSTLLVRMVPVDPGRQEANSSPTLPLGSIALGETAETAVYLGERMIVALLLPGQSVGGQADCPGTWYVAKPPEEMPSTDAVSIAASNSGKFWQTLEPSVRRQSLSLKELKRFLAPLADDGIKSVVITYLGHNSAKGDLYMTQGAGSVAPRSILRVFDAPSVAIINACEVATDAIEPGSMIAALSSKNVGTTIATVTPVNGPLAGAYMRCVASVLNLKKELTVGELQLRATQCLFSQESGASWGGERGYFAGKATNYFIVGNPYQKICLPPEAK